ncbi:hypothetical protein HDU79_002570 [Rhizoclosmatium sp. JEL0117]|nr:hypothetical protein HDU79_002570 [Rhizoclosmatium sp. JEL0117]
MSKGILLEVIVDGCQSDSESLMQIKSILQKLFSDISGYSALNLDAAVSKTLDLAGVEWLGKESSEDAYSSLTIMKLCDKLLS